MPNEWKHITILDRPYPKEKQAEALVVQMAVVEGYCDKCGFLPKCCSDIGFKPPVFAWCSQQKNRILKEWETEK